MIFMVVVVTLLLLDVVILAFQTGRCFRTAGTSWRLNTNRYTIDITYKIRHFEDIANLRPFKNLKKPLWEDAASAGYSFSWSSKIGRLNADLTLKCITRKFEIDGNYSIIVTQPIPAGPGTTKMVASPGTIA